MNLMIIYAVGLLMGFAIIGMVGLPVLLVFMVALWYWTLRRGLLTVRAFMYLGMLTQGASPMQANDHAFKVGILTASGYAPVAKSFVREYFAGKQLGMIAEARKRGFVG